MDNKSPNYFQEWIHSIYSPSCIVYSTNRAKAIFAKNNLKPSEFLRPFGNFSGNSINFTFSDKFTINMKNFRLNFFDNDQYKKINTNSFNQIMENVLLTNITKADWNLEKPSLSKISFEPILKKLKNYSFEWFNEYEKTLFECTNFNEFEVFQQPLAHIFICSVQDEIEEIELLKKKDNIPIIISEGIYEIKMPSMIIVLNDNSLNNVMQNDALVKKFDLICSYNNESYSLCCDINSLKEVIELNDLWTRFLHKIDIYSQGYPESYLNKERGKLVSLEDRENFKTSILKFFNEFIKPFLQRMVIDLDEEISNNKKGIKNNFLSMFKKTEKIEYINIFNIYKLIPIEKKIYLLSIIQFYMRDYENCIENVKLLMGDLKNKSIEHYYFLYELYNICHFLMGKKDIDHDVVYQNYIKSKNHKHALKYLLISIRMFEHLKKFSEIPKMLLKSTHEINISNITPLLFEKASLYYLFPQVPLVKKFCFFQILAGIAYKNQPNIDLKRYTLNCFGNIIYFFSRNNNSFIKLKEYLNSNMGEICMIAEYYKGALKFYNNCIELSIYKNIEQDQALYIRHFLKSLNSIINNTNLLCYVQINEFNIPEIINHSLIVIEEQDYEISKAFKWNTFLKYTKVKKDYINLSENDSNIIRNLDNIIDNKQNFTNFSSKRNFKTSVGNKIYARFLIRNPMNLNLSISTLKLICENSANQDNSTIEYEEQNFLLEKNSNIMKTIYCIPNIPGKVIIKGLEIGLYKIALFRHSFYKKNVNQLYIDKEKEKKFINKEITFDVIDEKTDIKVTFPSKEFNLYLNEFFNLEMKVTNNANLKIKRFCIFFDDNDINNEKVNCNSLSLNEFIFKEIDIPKDSEYVLNIPICPQIVGSFYLKMIIKFEEEMKFKEIEIKRFILKFNIIPSVKFSFNQELLSSYKTHSIFSLDINCAILNSNLSCLSIHKIYHKNYELTCEYDWKSIENESFEKFYSRYILKIMKNNLLRDMDFEFIENNDNNIHIKNRLNNLIDKNNILVHWSIKGEKEFNGLTSYNCNLKPQSTNLRYIKNVLNKTSKVEISFKSINSLKLVLIKLTIENLFEIMGENVSHYEVFISDEECEFNWIGIKSYKITEEITSKTDIVFSFLTDKSGQLDINKICINIFSKNSLEKPITITNIPHPIIIDI